MIIPLDAPLKNTALSLLLLLAATSLVTLSACGLSEFDDEIDTQFTVPQPKEGIFGLEPFTKTKRFKLGSDPNDAERATFKRARIQVLAPPTSDLSIIDRIEVHADVDGELTLLAQAEGFVPDERLRNLEVVFKDDIRGFVTPDNRVTMVFVVFPSTFAPSWPESGITIKADVTVRIEVL